MKAGYTVDPTRVVVFGRDTGASLALLSAFRSRDLVRAAAVIDAGSMLPPPEIDPGHRLAIYLGTVKNSMQAQLIKITLARLKAAKVPVTEKDLGKDARDLTPAEIAELRDAGSTCWIGSDVPMSSRISISPRSKHEPRKHRIAGHGLRVFKNLDRFGPAGKRGRVFPRDRLTAPSARFTDTPAFSPARASRLSVGDRNSTTKSGHSGELLPLFRGQCVPFRQRQPGRIGRPHGAVGECEAR